MSNEPSADTRNNLIDAIAKYLDETFQDGTVLDSFVMVARGRSMQTGETGEVIVTNQQDRYETDALIAGLGQWYAKNRE